MTEEQKNVDQIIEQIQHHRKKEQEKQIQLEEHAIQKLKNQGFKAYKTEQKTGLKEFTITIEGFLYTEHIPNINNLFKNYKITEIMSEKDKKLKINLKKQEEQ